MKDIDHIRQRHQDCDSIEVLRGTDNPIAAIGVEAHEHRKLLLGIVDEMQAAIKMARLESRLRQVTTREFAKTLGISAAKLTEWTGEWSGPPDILCSR